jgi:hypothetical protein
MASSILFLVRGVDSFNRKSSKRKTRRENWKREKGAFLNIYIVP